jgi:hypothetical protein
MGPREDRPDWVEGQEGRRSALVRVIDRSADRRRKRVAGILAQEAEPWSHLFKRTTFLLVCILFDGLILTEIPERLGGKIGDWLFYFILLFFVIRWQMSMYDRWFKQDKELAQLIAERLR